jgi:hypothetical protein
MKKFLTTLVLMLTLIPSIVLAAYAVLHWDAPNLYNDGTPPLYSDATPLPLEDIKAYSIWTGPTSTPLSRMITIPTSTLWPSLSTMTYTVISIPSGTWYFAVTCIAKDDGESDKSNIIWKYFPPPFPSAPRNLSAPGGVQLI